MIIRTELLAHNSKTNCNIDINTLLRIRKVSLFLEGKGRQPNTIESFNKHIMTLAKRTNLENPQEVELTIARWKLTDPRTKKLTNTPASNTYKQKLCYNYLHYARFHKIEWEVPKYVQEERSIQPPSDEKCQMLIASARGALSLRIDISAHILCFHLY